MSLSIEEIRKIAKLSRISLSEEEERVMSGQLSEVIGFFEKLTELDTSDVKLHMNESIDAENLRQDESRDSGIQEKILSQVPVREDAFIRVRPVL